MKARCVRLLQNMSPVMNAQLAEAGAVPQSIRQLSDISCSKSDVILTFITLSNVSEY